MDYARRQIKCPECRAEHRIPYQGVQTLPTNVTLIRFLDLHRSITGEEPEPEPTILERCGVCSEKAYVERCSHCDKKICADCREAHLDIMRREISRINNQVRRGLARLSEVLTQTQKNGEKLDVNFEHVKDEIEELARRYVKDVKDVETRLVHELEVYVQNETKNVSKLKDDLDIELANISSNCDLVEKHITEDVEWTDNELVEYKEIFLKTLDFLRNFDSDTSDYARRIKFQHNADPEVLHKTLINFGELKIHAPPQITSLPPTTQQSMSSPSLGPPSNALMRSQSDHRLATQFQRRQESPRNQYLEPGRYGSGHASDGERDSSLYSRNKREGESTYRSRLREYEQPDAPTGRSRFLRNEDGHYPSSRWRDSTDDLGSSGFRSRFARELVEDSGHESEMHNTRSVRFEEPLAPVTQREKVLDTDDASRGPLSGVVRLIDSSYIQERLHQNEARQKQLQIEKERKANEPPPAPTPAPPVVTPRRAPSRQISEDEIEKQKKQNQAAAANSSTAAAATTPSSPPPTPPPASPLATVPETPSTKPVPKRLASLQKDEDTSLTGRRDSRSQESGESGGSSRGSPFEDTPSPPQVPEVVPTRTTRWRRQSTDLDNQDVSPRTSTVEAPKRPDSRQQQSRSPRPPMGKSLSLDQDTDRRPRTSLLDKKEDTRSKPTTQTSYFNRLQSPKTTTKEDSDSESDSEVSSTESDSDDRAPKKSETPTNSPAVNNLLARSAQARKECAETKKDNSFLTRHSAYAREKEKDEGPQKSYRTRRETSKEDDKPVSKYTTPTRRRTSIVEEDHDDMPAYNRYLNRSRSSALLARVASRDDSPEERTSTDRRDSRTGLSSELRSRNSRISRSRSSHDMAINDDSTEDDHSASHRTRFERPSDTSSALSRSRSHHALKSREQSPDESASNSTWAQYLRSKYGSRKNSLTTSGKSTGRKSSLYSRSGSENSSDEGGDGDGGRRDSVFSRYGDNPSGAPYSFTFPRSMYMQKKKMSLRIGVRGTEPGCFTWPRGVAVGLDNSIVVADSSNHRVQVFDSNGKFLQEFGSYGSGEGEFDCLAGVAVNRIGQYIVSDRYNHRIQVFDPSGRFLRAFGCEGRTDGRFSYPWGITTDSLGFIYVCDKENHRIQVFQSDGTFVGKFGSIGSRPGHLEHPHYIAVSNTNRVIVSDSNNHRVQIFDVNGRSLSTFGTEGSDEGQFKFPRGIAVDDQGYIIVGDSGNNRIQIFHPDGTFLRAFGTWGASDGEFKGLEGIAVTSSGNILVCDRENHRIQVF